MPDYFILIDALEYDINFAYLFDCIVLNFEIFGLAAKSNNCPFCDTLKDDSKFLYYYINAAEVSFGLATYTCLEPVRTRVGFATFIGSVLAGAVRTTSDCPSESEFSMDIKYIEQ